MLTSFEIKIKMRYYFTCIQLDWQKNLAKSRDEKNVVKLGLIHCWQKENNLILSHKFKHLYPTSQQFYSYFSF